MSVVRFGWLGSTQRSALHAVLLDEVEAWARDWWWSSRPRIEAAPARRVGDGGIYLVWSTSADHLACALDFSSLASLGAMLAGTEADDEDDLALSLGRAAIERLAERIYRRAGLAVPTAIGREGDRIPPDLADIRLGAYRTGFVLGAIDLQLSLTRNLCDRLAPPPANDAATPPLVARTDAVAAVSVALSAVLDFGEASLAALSELHVGDVLVSDVDLHAPVAIQVDGHGVIAGARLHKRQDQRAIVLGASLPSTS